MNQTNQKLIERAEDLLLEHGRDVGTLHHAKQHPLRQRQVPEWRGAGVIISSEQPCVYLDMFDANAFVISSCHAARLAWSLERIQEAFRPFLDVFRKDIFFLELARMAKRRLKADGDTSEGCTAAQKDMVSGALETLRRLKAGEDLPWSRYNILTGPPGDED